MKVTLDNLKKRRIDKKKLVSSTSDGASVMLGKENGFHTKLASVCPIFTSVHCAAHRVNLTAVEAFT